MALARHLQIGGRWTFVGGKGGVGKTTVAAALAIELADGGEAVTLLSTDPAHSLGDALGVELGPEPRAVTALTDLEALEVDGDYERERFLREHGPSISTLLERGTYLDSSDIAEVTGLTLPGMDELAALLRLLRLADASDRRTVLDTAPTGHTLRLLELPTQALYWIGALDAMEAKHAAIANALAGEYHADEVADFVERLRDDLARTAAMLSDPEQTRFLLVTTVDPVVLAESRRYADRLAEMGIALGGIVVNRSARPTRTAAMGDRVVYVPELRETLVGVEGLRRFAAAAVSIPGQANPEAQTAAGESGLTVGPKFEIPTDRELYFVGGKGGVGKSTIAAALAIHLADSGRAPVLLLSVDPAGSLGEVLGQAVGTTPGMVEQVAGLTAQQLDAETAWADFRRQYEREVEGVFSGLAGGALSADHDREVIRRLLDLAPPGIDELMALVEVIDTTEDAAYDALVVDTAPTGHFLRLLQMPAVALDWTHTLLRLLLKYREVIGLGDLAERVLQLSRSLRRIQDRIMDPSQACFVTIALPESLSVPETDRLIRRLRELGFPEGALVVNRALENGRIAGDSADTVESLLEIAGGPAGAAPKLEIPPVGVQALRELTDGLRTIAGATGP